MKVAVSGAGGRMGRLVAATVAAADDLELFGLFDPAHDGLEIAGLRVTDRAADLNGADVIVEFTQPAVVMENVSKWRAMGAHAVVGTSGFTSERVSEATAVWGAGPPNLLIVPNFSIGAVLMMRLAEEAAPHFDAAEIIELHHDGKIDAPSGTAISTAERLGPHMPGSATVSGPSRGLGVAAIPIHSVRLPGLVAHQEVLFGNVGETLTIRHDSTDRMSFMPGVLLAIRGVPGLPGCSVGLDQLL